MAKLRIFTSSALLVLLLAVAVGLSSTGTAQAVVTKPGATLQDYICDYEAGRANFDFTGLYEATYFGDGNYSTTPQGSMLVTDYLPGDDVPVCDLYFALSDGEKIAAVNGVNYVSRDVRDGVAICTYATDKGVELYFIANVATGEKNIMTQQDSQGLYMVFDYSQPLPTA